MTPQGTAACSSCGILAMQKVQQGASSLAYASGLTMIGATLAGIFGFDLLLNLLGLTIRVFKVLDLLGDGSAIRIVFFLIGLVLSGVGIAWKSTIKNRGRED